MDENELKEIEARANAATPGEWRVETYRDEDADLLIDGTRAASMNTSSECGFDRQEDMVFIAHAREDIPALIAEVRRLTTGADIKVHCPHCKQLSLTVVTGGRLIKNEPEGELK